MRDWMWSLGVAARTATAADLGDEHGTGADGLRDVLAAYLRRVRGAAAQPDAIVVCAGFRYGLNLVLRALAADGISCVALEDPGPVDHDELAARCGLDVVYVPVDDRGLDVAALAATPARVVVVTPAHQAPDRGGARARASAGAARLGGRGRRRRDRGRLRRRVPLRQASGRFVARVWRPSAWSRWGRRARRSRRPCAWAGWSARRAGARRWPRRSTCSAEVLRDSTSWRSPR